MGQNRTSKYGTRKFLGKTEDFKDKQERAYHQRMLKGYLKGKEFFSFGFTDNKDEKTGFMYRVPARYAVLQTNRHD